MLKLFQVYDSPFPTRVRLLLRAKNIPHQIIEPPGFKWDGTPKGDYLEINPIGRVPALVLEDGRALPESEVICEYLEDAYPEPPLRPADPFARATMRLISRICDIYLVMAMVPLFNASGRPRKSWDPDRLAAAMGEIAKALAYLEEYIGTEGYAVGKALTQADGALVPQLVLASEWAPMVFGLEDPLPAFPKLSAYWTAIQKDALAGQLIEETREGIRASRERAKARNG